MTEARRGFTAIELLVVISIMLVLMAIAVPSIVPAMRKGALHRAANDIESCWRQARFLATASMPSPGTNPPHYGIVICQATGARPYAAIIYDNVGSGTAPKLFRQGQDPQDTAFAGYDSSRSPVAQFFFNRGVVIASGNDAATATTNDCTITVYAQYRTGLPISPADVANGRGNIAGPTSIGLLGMPSDANDATTAAAAAAPSVLPALRLQTLDYTAGSRGYAVGIGLYHAGLIATASVQE